MPVPGQDKHPLWVARVHNQFVPIKGVTDFDGLKSLFLGEYIFPKVPKPVLINSLPPSEQVIAGPTKNAVRWVNANVRPTQYALPELGDILAIASREAYAPGRPRGIHLCRR